MIGKVKMAWLDSPVQMGISTIVGCAVGGLLAFGILGFLNSEPAVIIHRDESMAVRVHGTDVIVDVDAVRIRPACPGAYAIRRMKQYAPDGKIMDVAFIQERDLAGPEVGARKYHLHLHLFSPLKGTGWKYSAELHDECSLLPALFARRAAITDPTPVTIMQDDLPDAGGAGVSFDQPQAQPQAYDPNHGALHQAITAGSPKHPLSYQEIPNEIRRPRCAASGCYRDASIGVPQ